MKILASKMFGDLIGSALSKTGTSSGAKRGWETRRGRAPVDEESKKRTAHLNEPIRLDCSDIPEGVKQVSEAVGAAGGRALLVGGSVRDKIMGKKPKDYDIEVYGVRPDHLEETLKKLGKVDAVGKSFGILKIKLGDTDLDVSIPRRESKVGAGHKGFLPQPDPTMSVAEAARRRDFTMNSMAMDPKTGDVFDPFGGVEDINRRVIKATDPTTFVEDPLRVLRGAQFAARFGMEIDPSTEELCRGIKNSLRELPRERVGGEWEKLLLKSERPSMGLEAMRRMGALGVLHPEIESLATTEQDPEWHPEGNVFAHTKMVVDEAVRESKGLPSRDRRDVIYAALLHDIAKPETTVKEQGGRITSHGHESAGQGKAEKILRDQFAVDKDTADRVGKLVGNHLNPSMLYRRRDEIGDSAIRRLAKRIEPATIEALVALARADNFGRGVPGVEERKSPETDWLLRRAKALSVEREAPKPILQGRHLIAAGMKPGKEMGDVLRRIYELQMSGEVTSLDDALVAAGVKGISKDGTKAGAERGWETRRGRAPVERPKVGRDYETAQEMMDFMREKHPEASVIFMPQPDGTIELAVISVPEGERSKGKGTAAMRDMVGLADSKGVTLTLKVAEANEVGAEARERLFGFYKRFGFVLNDKGKYNTRSSDMYREPRTAQSFTTKKTKFGEGFVHRIKVGKRTVGHVSGFEEEKKRGGEYLPCFHIYRTEMSDESLRGTGMYREAVQEIANQYAGGAYVHEWEASGALKGSLKKMPTYEFEQDTERIWIKPEAQKGISKDGTSEGAIKGWETRRRGGPPPIPSKEYFTSAKGKIKSLVQESVDELEQEIENNRKRIPSDYTGMIRRDGARRRRGYEIIQGAAQRLAAIHPRPGDAERAAAMIRYAALQAERVSQRDGEEKSWDEEFSDYLTEAGAIAERATSRVH